MLENSRGNAVDPVPFLVVAGLAVVGCYGMGPPYLMAFGLAQAEALALSTAALAATTAAAYHRLVWTTRPDLTREVPPDLRLQRLLLGSLAVAGVMALLLLPLLGP